MIFDFKDIDVLDFNVFNDFDVLDDFNLTVL